MAVQKISEAVWPDISFGKLRYEETEGADCTVISLEEVNADQFEQYQIELKNQGFEMLGEHKWGETTFCEWTKKKNTLFLSYYPSLRQMLMVSEADSGYIDGCYRDFKGTLIYQDTSCLNKVSSKLTQINLEDFGISYLFRLSDGRFVVIDGGWDFEPDADKLYRQLMAQKTDGEKPVIAAWILTHPHIDHYRCFLVFMEKYAQEAEIQRMIYNFPEITEDWEQKLPCLAGFEEIPNLQKMDAVIKKQRIPVIRAHTGQTFEFANIRLEVLSSLDDVCSYPIRDGNITSLIIKAYIEGQSILFCGDAYLKDCKLAERYGSYLKSDILQITHHGFNGGSMEAYALVNPDVCLAPVDEETFFCNMGYYHKSNQSLIYHLNVQDFLISGIDDKDIVLSLPYLPRPNGRKLLLDKAEQAQKSMGATTWYFADMAWESCKFSALNATSVPVTVYVDLFFEDINDLVRKIKITLPGYQVARIDFQDETMIDGDALFFNRGSLKNRGIPQKGKVFTVRFTSKYPVIIWGEKEPVYKI